MAQGVRLGLLCEVSLMTYKIKWKSDKEKLENKKKRRQEAVRRARDIVPPKKLTVKDIRELMQNVRT